MIAFSDKPTPVSSAGVLQPPPNTDPNNQYMLQSQPAPTNQTFINGGALGGTSRPGKTMPAPPPPTAMSPAPGPYSPYGNNPQPVQKPTLPGPPEGTGPGGEIGPVAGGGGNFNGWNPDEKNFYGGQQIAGARPDQADYNSVQGYADKAYENSRRYLDPQQETQNQRFQQELINKGIDPNSAQGQKAAQMLAMQQNDQNNAASFGAMQFGQGIQNQMAQQGLAQQGLAGQMQQALWQNQLGASGQNLNWQLGKMGNELGYAGLNTQTNIAGMQDKTNRLGINNNYNLGMAGIEAGNYRADLQHQLGMGNLDMQRQGQDFNQMLGLEGIDFRNQQYQDMQGQYQDQITMALMGMTPVPGVNAIDPNGAFGTTISSAGSNQGLFGRVLGF